MTDQERCIDALRKISGNTDPGITFPGLLANALEKLSEGGSSEIFTVEYVQSTPETDPTVLRCDMTYAAIKEKIDTLGINGVVASLNGKTYRLESVPKDDEDIVFLNESFETKTKIYHTINGLKFRQNTYTGAIAYCDSHRKVDCTASELERRFRDNHGISIIQRQRYPAEGSDLKGAGYPDYIILKISAKSGGQIQIAYAFINYSGSWSIVKSNTSPDGYFTLDQ